MSPCRYVLAFGTFAFCLQVYSNQKNHCETLINCNYNGECINNECVCDPQWKGMDCSQLNLLPTQKSSGYQHIENGERVSSWGGSVLRDNTNGIYHMYQSEILHHCGINVWLSNSFITHSTSADPLSTFTKTNVNNPIVELWSHEPNAVRGPNGEYILFFVHTWPPPTYIYPRTDCANGISLNCDVEPPKIPKAQLPTKMIYANNPNGPWSDPMLITTQNMLMDSVLAVYIYPNGSLIGLFRGDDTMVHDPNFHGGYGYGGTAIYSMRATNWKDNTTYRYEAAQITPGGVREDPFLWMDRNGILHSLWHDGFWSDPVGYHTFSNDGGKTWIGPRKDHHAYTSFTEFEDGTNYTFRRCERPHLIFDTDGFTPIALTNAVEIGGDDYDYTYTLLRPINQHVVGSKVDL